MTDDLSFSPDWAIPPGETIQELIDDRGWTQTELAARLHITPKHVNELIQGKAMITAGMAILLERVLGLRAVFWLNLDQNYREAIARQLDRETLAGEIDWLKTVPVKALVEKGWVQKHSDPVSQLQAVLGFFGCASPGAVDTYCASLQVSFRKSAKFESNPMATATWLRRGEILGQEVECRPYDRAAFRRALREIRLLTPKEPREFYPQAQQLCADAGVAFVIVPELPGCRVNGAARWLSKDKAIVQLSLRYSWSDIFWFSFFHEAGHVLLHNKKKAVFLDEGHGEDPDEQEANRFSAEHLISTADWSRFRAGRGLDLESVERFAEEQGIHPGIVVGRLQHEGVIPFNHPLNRVKTRFKWVSGN